jgi:diaminohydroxyphosphoribosylaminopyrimidine deaminase/5-amino-6-(5-phosphoribosylamino)uracil reductase
MTADVREIAAMRRAIEMSALGLGSTSPNPPVGCVILDSAGRLVGEGYHQRKGESHAEVNALKAAGHLAAGGTAMVTLEPCNHHGRTPPCHQALIDAGIARVLIAVIDPTSRGAGGAARLREAGVQVEVDVLTDEALVVLHPWMTALKTSRPKVIWVCDNTAGGLRQLSDEVLEETGLRCQADALLLTDGRVEEGVQGAHGPGAFELPTTVRVAEPESALSLLYRAGARTVLLHGAMSLAGPFAAGSFIDEIKVFMAVTTASRTVSETEATGLSALTEFKIQAVRRLNHGVLIETTM